MATVFFLNRVVQTVLQDIADLFDGVKLNRANY